jgi:uncharacterized membrane protein
MMKQERLENLADGIFAIVMTLLVLDLKLPNLGMVNTYTILHSFHTLLPYFMSYLTSFAMLYVYWHAHHFIISVYAKNLTIELSNINAVFLFLIGLVPFSSHVLGLYHTSPVIIVFFSLHIIMIGLVLYWMRWYIKHAPSVHNREVTKSEEDHSQARILFPVFCAVISILISFIDPFFSLFSLTLGILFNYSKQSTRITFAFLQAIFHGKSNE